jgi:hypothetical protein
MKKNLFLISLLIAFVYPSFINAKKQDFRPLFKEGKVWNCYMSNGSHVEYNMAFIAKGDSIVDGDKCVKMFFKMTDIQTGELLSEGDGGLFLEKDRKVFQREKINGTWTWTLLYDFNLKEGDSWAVSNSQKMAVTAIDTIAVRGNAFRRMKMAETLESRHETLTVEGYWVEGVGSSKGLTKPYGWTYDGGTFRLLSCYEDGECIFAEEDFYRKGSETYESVLRHGHVWKTEFNMSLPEMEGNYSYETTELMKVFVIDEIPFKQVYYRYQLQGGDGYALKPLGFLIGEKDGRIYHYEELNERYTPIMDFALSMGEQLVMTVSEYNEVIREDTFTVVAVSDTILESSTDKRLRHCVYVKDKIGYDDCWVEGIGSLRYGLNIYRNYAICNDAVQQLIWCAVGDETLYYAKGTNGIENKPVASKARFEKASPLLDLQGRPVVGTPKRGIYVKDGRKYVVK